MPDKTVRAVDPLGIIALAQVLSHHTDTDCSCEHIPVPCSCVNKDPCPCQCQNECSCELIPVHDLMAIVSNPVFREAVKSLDVGRLKSIEDFLNIAGEIRAKMDLASSSSQSTKAKRKSR